MTDFNCLIIDNNSPDNSAKLIGPLITGDNRFEFIKLDDNIGFAAANNLAAQRADTPWVACLNPDAFARSDWLETLMAQTLGNPDITMVGSTQIMADAPDTYDGNGDCYHVFGLAWRSDYGKKIADLPPRQACEVFAPCGAGALYQRDIFLTLGGFDERFFCYHEDVDLGFRMRLAGGICIQSADAVIEHMGSASSGRLSEFAVYHGTRNRIWTFFKNMPVAGLWLFTLPHIALNLALLLRAGFRRGTFKATTRGISAGLSGLPAIWETRNVMKSQRAIGFGSLLSIMAISPLKAARRSQHSKILK